MNKDKALVWVGVAVVIIGIFIFAVWGFQAPAELHPTYAPKGQVTPQFPQELVLNNNAPVDSSYTINYASSTNQYTTSWTSSSSVITVAQNYLAYFAANGWIAQQNPTTSVNVQSISATKGTSQVLVAAVKESIGKTQVTVTYLPQ